MPNMHFSIILFRVNPTFTHLTTSEIFDMLIGVSGDSENVFEPLQDS
jgi:hypothetical protein